MSDYVEPDFDTDFEDVPPPVTFYTQMIGERTNYPFSCDCSGLVWWSFNQMGLADVMFPSSEAGVSEMIEWFEVNHWRSADLLLRWNDPNLPGPHQTTLARLTLNQTDPPFLQEGDLLYRCDSPSGEGDHVAWFVRWEGTDTAKMTVYDAHYASNPPVGERTLNYDYVVNTFTHVVRPQPIGYLMWHRYLAAVPKAV